jgi:hypothetical protein
MTSVLIIVAILLVGSAIWGFWGAGLGRGGLRSGKSPLRKAPRASAPPLLADDPRSRGDSFGREKRGGAITKQARVHSDTLAGGIHVAMPSAWWAAYTPLVVLFLCLWVIDTENLAPAWTSFLPGVSCGMPSLVLLKQIDWQERTRMRQREQDQTNITDLALDSFAGMGCYNLARLSEFGA